MNNLTDQLLEHYFKTVVLDDTTIKLPSLKFDGIDTIFTFSADWKYNGMDGLRHSFNSLSQAELDDNLTVLLEFRIIARINPLNMAIKVKKDLIQVENAFVYEYTSILWVLCGGMAEEAIDKYKERRLDYEGSFREFIGNKYKNDIYHNMAKQINKFKYLLPKLRFDSYSHILLEPTNQPDVEKQHIMLWKQAKDEEYNCECCVCSEGTRYKTDCGHNLCLICHMKLEKMGDEDNEVKCPMCRNEYDILNWS
jgi:hypothetical protein